MQIHLTYRNTLRNVKRRVLHTRAFAMYYITRRVLRVGIRKHARGCSRWLTTHQFLQRTNFLPHEGGKGCFRVCFASELPTRDATLKIYRTFAGLSEYSYYIIYLYIGRLCKLVYRTPTIWYIVSA